MIIEMGSERSSKLGDQRSIKSLMRFAGPSCSCQSVDCASGAQKARSGGDRARIGPADLLVGGLVEAAQARARDRSEEHTSELQSLMRISYAVFCLKKKKETTCETTTIQ